MITLSFWDALLTLPWSMENTNSSEPASFAMNDPNDLPDHEKTSSENADSTGSNAGPNPVESETDEPNETTAANFPPALPRRNPWEQIPLPGQGQLSESEDRTWGMLCHLAAFAGLLLPSLGNIIGPLIVWLIKRDTSPFVDAHGKESLNFQISMTIYLYVGGTVVFGISVVLSLLICLGSLMSIFLGLLLSCLVIVAIIYQIVAAIRAKEGGFLRYPLTIRFFR